jgi:hypothetical protein
MDGHRSTLRGSTLPVMHVADATSDPVEIGILRSTAVFLRETKFCRRVRRRTSPPPLGAGTV